MAKKTNAANVMKYFNDKESAHIQKMQKGGSLNGPYASRGKTESSKNIGEVSQSPTPSKSIPVVVQESWNNR